MENTKEQIKFKANYEWPEVGSTKDCPKCGKSLQLNEQSPQYYGKPWWCGSCKWQFSEEDIS